MCKIQSEENKNNYERNLTTKIVSRAMSREAEQQKNDLYNKPNNVFKVVKFLKKEGQDVNGG